MAAVGKFNLTARSAFGILKKGNGIFLFTVVIPTLVSIVYFGFLASDVYVSESVFLVRRADKPASSGFGVILKSAGFSNANEETYAAQDYVLSRDALEKLNRNNYFSNSFSSQNISWVDRFNFTGYFGSFEDLYELYRKKIDINYDTTSGLSTLTVRAYSNYDAQRINERLLQLTEATVNRLNQRARRDLIRVAESEVQEAKDKSRIAASALAEYRNQSGIIDPERQAVVQLQMISKLQDQLIATNTQLDQLRNFASDNPQIEVLKATAKSLEEEINRQAGGVAGGRKSLSAVAIKYQRLLVESQFADKQLAAMLASLAEARSESRKQQAYIERIVQPNRPDEATEPRRLRGVLTTFVLGLVAFGIVSMLLAGIREHQD